MLRSYLTHSDIIKREPQLSDYLRNDQISFADIIANAKIQMQMDLKNRGKELKKLCTLFELTDSTKTDEDEIERTRIVLTVTAIDGSAVWLLEGTNNESNETWNTVLNNIQAAELGVYTHTFDNTYKYYRITATGTVTYTAYLVEQTFELPHLYLSLALIYKSLENLTGDIYGNKAEMYNERYLEVLDNSLYSYDDDLDGSAEKDEIIQNRTMFIR